MKLVTDEAGTKLIVKRALRKDTGEYTLSASNEGGIDTAVVRITVLDRYVFFLCAYVGVCRFFLVENLHM